MRELGDDIIKNVQKRTSLGISVDENGNTSKFKELSPGYIAQRKGEAAFFTKSNKKRVGINQDSSNSATTNSYIAEQKPKLHNRTTPSKSNLTRTGEMLYEALTYFITTGKLKIKMKNAENQKKADLVSEKRPFLNLSKAEMRKIVRKIQKIVKNVTDRNIKKTG